MLAVHYTEKNFAHADSLYDHDKSKAARYIDSVYDRIPSVSVADKCRYYLFNARLNNIVLRDTVYNSKAIAYTDSIIMLIENTGLTREMAKEYANAFRQKGEYCLFSRKYEEAIRAVSMCKFISQRSGDSCTASDNTSTLALISLQQDKYPAAADYFKEAILLSRSCDNNKEQFYRLQGQLDNLGIAYERSGQLDSAIRYYRMDEQYILNNKHLYYPDTAFPYQALTVVYGNLASALSSKGYLDSAISYLEKCTMIDRDILHSPESVDADKTYTAGFYLQKKEVKKAALDPAAA